MSIKITYDAEFPEQGNWVELIDSRHLDATVRQISAWISKEFEKPVADRIHIPGLRLALNMIAVQCTIRLKLKDQ